MSLTKILTVLGCFMEGYNFPDSKRPRLEGFAAGEYYKYQGSATNNSEYNSLRPSSAHSQSSLASNLFPMHQQTGMTNYGSSVGAGLHYDASQYASYRHTPPLLHHRNQYVKEEQKPFTSPFSVESALPSVSSYSPMSYSNATGLTAQSQYSTESLYRTSYGGSNLGLDNAYHHSSNEQKPQNNWLCSTGTFGAGAGMTSSMAAQYQNMPSTAGAMAMDRNFAGTAGYKFSPYSPLDHHLPPSNSPPTANMYSMLPKMETAMGTASMGHMGGPGGMFNSTFNPMYGTVSPNSSCQYGSPYGHPAMQPQNPYGPPAPPAVPLMNPRWQYDFRGYAEEFLDIEMRLSQMLSQLRFGGQVTYIYNPVQYAYEPHSTYVKRFCTSRKRILFLGMNPGPYGMAQTGVPFGEVKVVKEWLKITGEIHKPPVEHPKKPIWGFDCPRSEVSGQRFWGLFTKICKEPEAFFENCFVHNLCPLIFINHTGKSLTPPDLPAAERRMLLEICERAICEVVQLLGVELVIGVGKFAQERARVALKAAGMDWIRVETIMHPSPANPLANKGWDAIAEKQLEEMGAMAIIKSAVPPTPPPPPVTENSTGDTSNSSNNPRTPTSQGSGQNTTSGNKDHTPAQNAIGNGATHININNANTTSHVSHNNTSTIGPHSDSQPAINTCNDK